MSEVEINTIKQVGKSLLNHNEELWIKKGVSRNFENLLGLYDLPKLP